MNASPDGTVTFLFTDIQGSTSLWEHHSAEMKLALERHDRTVRSCIVKNDGYVFKTVGDEFCSAFSSAPSALAAAIDVQFALEGQQWETPTPIIVRMAIHTGDVISRDDDYYGPTLNRVARLLASGHGGQILVSLVSAELIRDRLPESVELLDMGFHRLKDLIRPECVFQVLHPSLNRQFPPLKSLESRPNNLPVQPTPFVGRHDQLNEVKTRLKNRASRLVTLVGTGGMGKTRFSLQLAADLLDEYDDGAFFFELSDSTTTESALERIAYELSLPEKEGMPVLSRLAGFLEGKCMLLIFDNCEQIPQLGKTVADLLASTVSTQIVATSREPLHIRGEFIYRIPSMSFPSGTKMEREQPGNMNQFESVRLFIDRAVDLKPDFMVTNANAPAIADICAKLDGVPLAIELAATWIQLLSPESISQRLSSQLNLLTSGAQDLPDRQQTLRAAIEWSYNLLDSSTQEVFRRLSAIPDTFTIAAAESICLPLQEQGADLLKELLLLVDKSLVLSIGDDSGENRFSMLRMLQEYANERQMEWGGAEPLKDRLAVFCEDLIISCVDADDSAIKMRNNRNMVRRFSAEHRNIIASIEWLIATKAVERAVRLIVALREYWNLSGSIVEPRRLISECITGSHQQDADSDSAELYLCEGILARTQGDYESAETSLLRALELSKSTGKTAVCASAYHELGWVYYRQHNLDESVRFFKEGVRQSQEAGDDVLIARCRMGEANYYWRKGDLDHAKTILSECRQTFRDSGEERLELRAAGNVGVIHYMKGDWDHAEEHYLRVKELCEKYGSNEDLWIALNNLGDIKLRRGMGKEASGYYRQLLSAALTTKSRLWEGIARAGVAESHLIEDKAQEAFDEALGALAALQDLAVSAEHGICNRVLGMACAAMDRMEKADEYLQTAIAIFEETAAADELEKAREVYRQIFGVSKPEAKKDKGSNHEN